MSATNTPDKARGADPSADAGEDDAKVIVDMSVLGEGDEVDDVPVDPEVQKALAFSSPLTPALHGAPPPAPPAKANMVDGDPNRTLELSAISLEDAEDGSASRKAARPPQGRARQGRDSLDLEAIRQPRVGRFVLMLIMLALAGVLLFIAWKNQFDPVIWEDPRAAVEIAFTGHDPRPAPPPPEVEAPAPQAPIGALKIINVTLEPLPGGHALLTGQITNPTEGTHRAVTLEAQLRRDDLPLYRRVIPCCTTFDEAQAIAVAKDPAHPHFATALPELATIEIPPGGRRLFNVVFRKVGATRDLQPFARVKHSEASRAPAPR